jgi:serine/threonine-protein kinase
VQPPPAKAGRSGGGCLGRLVRTLVIMLILAAIVGGGIYYVFSQQVAPKLREISGDTPSRVIDDVQNLIDDNTK